jgi:putative CocE/NonD family hydrolase
MKSIFTCLFLIFAEFSILSAQNPSADSAFIRDYYTKMEVLIPMRDGVRLFTSIYIPKDTSRTYPILLRRTPYSCAPYGSGDYTTRFQNMTLARAGYIWVTQDVRGRYMSEGLFQDVRPYQPNAHTENGQGIDEATDTYDTVDWLVKNLTVNNGRVGVYGISYPGFYATMAILARHPAVRAVSPQAPVTDWFIGDDFHHGGAFFVMDAFSFYSGFGLPRPQPTTKGNPGFSNWNTPDNYDFYLRAGALRNYNERYLQNKVSFWNELMEHPDYDDWWKARNPRPHLTNVRTAVMTVGGLFDAEDCWGAWNTYQSVEKQNPAAANNRIVMGPWTHGGWARNPGDRLGSVVFGQPTSQYYQEKVEYPFFEFHLKDRGTLDLPEALVFETGSNRWTRNSQWPPQGVRTQKMWLSAKSVLTSAAAGSGEVRYVSDPAKPVPYTEDVHLHRTNEYMVDDQRFAARRPDVLVFETPVLRDTLRTAGSVVADLWVQLAPFQKGGPKQLDADFIVKLIDVFPDALSGKEKGVALGGYQMLVRGEILRGRYRNSFERPEPFKAGKWERVRVTLPDVAHAFLPGHRLMIQVQSSWFPLTDRNPQKYVNIYKATDEDFIPLIITVGTGGSRASAIELPIR